MESTFSRNGELEILIGEHDEYILDGTKLRKDVYFGRARNTGRIVGIKFVRNQPKLRLIPNECSNLISVFDTQKIESGEHAIVFEWLAQGDLSKRSAYVSNNFVEVALQIARGLRILHLQKIAHGHLKPSNILLDWNGVVKIGDLDFHNLTSGVRNSDETAISRDLHDYGKVLYQLATNDKRIVFKDKMKDLKRKLKKLVGQKRIPNRVKHLIGVLLSNPIPKTNIDFIIDELTVSN
jgi:tRNA A-37 threonylcarbamoyl transferase component Bud32